MSSRPWRFALATALALALQTAALADSFTFPDKQETFGGVAAPAALPPGSTAAYGFLGAPELGGGFRQGFTGGFELETRAKLNYLLLSLAAEAVGRYRVNIPGRIELAPFLGLGLVGDTGSRYYDPSNFAYVGLRFLGGAAVTYRVLDTVRLIGELDVPFDLPLGSGGWRFKPLLGGGAEIYLGNDFSGLIMGQLGPDLFRPPADVSAARLGYSIRLGLGYRFF